MKHFTEILDDIKVISDEIDTAAKNRDRMDEEWMKFDDRMERHNAHMALLDDIAAEEARINDMRAARRLIQNNARVALYHDVLPVVLEVLQKYAGKPYGEKTREKIAQEVKARTGARAYISSRYGSDEINIYPDTFGTTYNITCGPRPEKVKDDVPRLLDEKNRITPQPAELFKLFYIKSEYVFDVWGAVEEMKRLYTLAVEKQAELESICAAFNAIACDGIEHIYKDKSIWKYFKVD